MRTRLVATLFALSFSPPASALYQQTDLVSDLPAVAAHQDPNLVNPWGLAAPPGGPFWTSNNGTGTATLYHGDGTSPGLVVALPPISQGEPPSPPTGVVFNESSGFEVAPGAPARFLFATEDGMIAGWSPSTGSTALRAVIRSGTGASYKGLALGQVGGAPILYAANFASGSIDVFDATFSQSVLGGSFVDPNLPAGYAPFNIQNLAGSLYVAYARVDTPRIDALPGAGQGIVDVFDTSGNLLRRLATGGALNAPWGLALAPAGFGELSGAVLVGNFGDGTIHGYDPVTGAPVGSLDDSPGHALEIDGLWGLAFGDGSAANGPKQTLFFTAGIAGPGAIEDHGLFGALTVVPEPSSLALVAAGLAPLARRRAGRAAPR